MSSQPRLLHFTAALLLGSVLSVNCAWADCPRGDVKCRLAEQKEKQQQADAAKQEQQANPDNTGGATRWDPDAAQGKQIDEPEEEEEDDYDQ